MLIQTDAKRRAPFVVMTFLVVGAGLFFWWGSSTMPADAVPPGVKNASPSAPAASAFAATQNTAPDMVSSTASSAANKPPVGAAKERNPGITPQQLSANRTETAKMFLRQVTLQKDARGGFIVQDVDGGSLYAAMGLQRGDRVFSIDTPGNAHLDESSIEDMTAVDHVELEVYRKGHTLLLKVDL